MLDLSNIEQVYRRLQSVVVKTPLSKNLNISDFHKANVYLKREDLQHVRSYKIRGAYNKISLLSDDDRNKGVVCASAGNHAQGVAYSCNLLNIFGVIFMPVTTPAQKVNKVKMFGKSFIEVRLIGDSFDDAYRYASEYCNKEKAVFIHPFDDSNVIEGQATVAYEVLKDADFKIDYLFFPIGGGGLAAGICSYFKKYSPHTKLIGAEPTGAPSMSMALKAGEPVFLNEIDTFVDGASVRQVGQKTFAICKELMDDIVLVPEGKICSTILRLYNEDAIVVEPAGALSVSALDFFNESIKGKNVVCIVSGSNNDIVRTAEIKERSMLYEGLKHYFIIRFPQRPGALKDFLINVLGPNDDIAYFEYSKKNSRDQGPAIIGIELKLKEDFDLLINRMIEKNIIFEYLNNKPDLFQFLI
jgi:threonine dehydratase